MRINTPQRIRDAIDQLNLGERDLAEFLRMGKGSRRTIGRWKSGESAIPGAVAMWLEWLCWNELPEKPKRRPWQRDDK